VFADLAPILDNTATVAEGARNAGKLLPLLLLLLLQLLHDVP
jgi:hypothetical protein